MTLKQLHKKCERDGGKYKLQSKQVNGRIGRHCIQCASARIVFHCLLCKKMWHDLQPHEYNRQDAMLSRDDKNIDIRDWRTKNSFMHIMINISLCWKLCTALIENMLQNLTRFHKSYILLPSNYDWVHYSVFGGKVSLLWKDQLDSDIFRDGSFFINQEPKFWLQNFREQSVWIVWSNMILIYTEKNIV
jgi:hypothetical protein